MQPLFPTRSPTPVVGTGVLTLFPYRHEAAWVFDDPQIGLVKEPFVEGIDRMIDRLTGSIETARSGFRLRFAEFPFEGWQTSLTWLRADPVEGNWYRANDAGDEGWLCPALFFYFAQVPPMIYVAADATTEITAPTGLASSSP